MLSQKDAVYTAIYKVFESNNKTIDSTARVVLDKQEKILVASTIVLLFKHNKIELSESSKTKYMTSDVELMKYAKCLVTNWIERDKRLNGGNKLEVNRFNDVMSEFAYIKSRLNNDKDIQVMNSVIAEYPIAFPCSTNVKG